MPALRYVEKIYIEQGGRTWIFLANCWIDADAPCELHVVPVTATYTITVMTGSDDSAGTDATISCTLVCEDVLGGTKEVTVLLYDGLSRNFNDAFEPGQKDAFDFELPRLQNIHKLVISHDGEADGRADGAAWLLNGVVISSDQVTSSTTWHFPCKRWLDDEKGAECGYPATRTITVYKESLVTYQIWFLVTNVRCSSLTLNLKIYGSRSWSDQLFVNIAVESKPGESELLERQIKCVEVELQDLGDIEKVWVQAKDITLGEAEPDLNPKTPRRRSAGWTLESVAIRDVAEGNPGELHCFRCQAAVMYGEPLAMEAYRFVSKLKLDELIEHICATLSHIQVFSPVIAESFAAMGTTADHFVIQGVLADLRDCYCKIRSVYKFKRKAKDGSDTHQLSLAEVSESIFGSILRVSSLPFVWPTLQGLEQVLDQHNEATNSSF